MKNMIKMVNITKKFGDIEALTNVNFEMGDNEIVGLVGDNGAGKSTFIKIINGFQRQTSGEFYLESNLVHNFSVSKARDFGIETVYQEKALANLHTLWRNIFMGREISKSGFFNINQMIDETEKLMREFMGFTSKAFNSDSVVQNLSGGEKQGVAIARALYFNAKLIILDEPTMSLSISETRKVLDFINKIKSEGKACIFIDHNIFHLYPVVERIVMLDRGKIIGTFLKKDILLDELTEKLQRVAKSGRLEENNIN